MSETRDDSDFSSALYLNNEKEREKLKRSIKSREKSSIVSSSQLDASFRLIKGLIDTKNMIKDLFFKLGMTVILTSAVIIAVSIILALLLYLAMPDCSCCSDMSGYFNNPNTGLEVAGTRLPYSDDGGETILTPDGRKERRGGWFWMTQIWERLDQQNEEIAKILRNSIYDIVGRVLTELDNKFKEQEHRTISLYLNLKRAEEFEFKMPQGGKSKIKLGTDRRLPDPYPPRVRPTRGQRWFRPSGPPAIMSKYIKRSINSTMAHK